jgi:hypothetical protein
MTRFPQREGASAFEAPMRVEADMLLPDFAFFPATDVLPFHYPHPVTGQPWK